FSDELQRLAMNLRNPALAELEKIRDLGEIESVIVVVLDDPPLLIGEGPDEFRQRRLKLLLRLAVVKLLAIRLLLVQSDEHARSLEELGQGEPDGEIRQDIHEVALFPLAGGRCIGRDDGLQPFLVEAFAQRDLRVLLAEGLQVVEDRPSYARGG